PSRNDRRVYKEKTGVTYEHLANNGQAASVSPQGTFPDRSISKSVDSAEGGRYCVRPNVRHERQTSACRWLSARWGGWTSLKHPLVVEISPNFYGNPVSNGGPEAHSLRVLHCSLIEPTIATGTLNNNVSCPSLVGH